MLTRAGLPASLFIWLRGLGLRGLGLRVFRGPGVGGTCLELGDHRVQSLLLNLRAIVVAIALHVADAVDDHVPGLPGIVDLARSEERRVGKECRSRWSPDH